MKCKKWDRVRLCVLVLLGLGTVPAAAQPPRRPEIWTIAVGVDAYENVARAESRTAAQGARRVREWFARAGWDGQHLLLLSDGGAEDPGRPEDPAPNIRPTKKNLDWAFGQWLFSRAREGDLVVFYFAGRAGSVVTPRGPRLDPQVNYDLLPADARPDAIGQTGWSLERAVDDCARKRLGVVCWLATSMGEQPAADRPVANLPSGVNWLGRLARWPGITAWLASDRPRGQDGVNDPGDRFTRALLEALGPPDEAPGRNLAACLKDLQQDTRLMRQGFRTLGGVPPSLGLRKVQFGRRDAEPEPELVLQLGHGDKTTALATTADGRLVLSASQDSTVRVWSAQDGSLIRAIPASTAEVGITALALSGDDRWLISGGGRGTVTILDRDRNWKPALVPRQPHGRGIVQITVLPDGFHFASLDRDGLAFLWDTRESPQDPKPWIADRACRQVACGGRFAPDGKDAGIAIAWCDDARLRTSDPAGAGAQILDIPAGSLTAMAVSPEGRFIGLCFGDGKVVVRDRVGVGGVPRQAEYKAADPPAKARRLTFSAAGALAIEHDRGLRLVIPGSDGSASDKEFALIDKPIQSLAFSPSGEYVAASTEGVGALRVWRLGGSGPPESVLDDQRAGASLVSFTGNNRALIVGGFGGELAMRPMGARGEETAWNVPAAEGKVQALGASPDRRYLLLLDRKESARYARIWDLKDRTCRRLRGSWMAGAFLDDDRLALIADSAAKGMAGRLARLDRRDLGIDPSFFARESGGFRVPESLAFERIAVSPDGRWVAAASDASKVPLVCVWRADNGQLSHWITDDELEDAVLALSFSSDGQSLLTGGDSPVAQLWDLSAGQGRLKAPVVRFKDPSIRKNITCAAIRPGDARQVVIGHSDGQVNLWTWAGGKASLEASGLIQGEFAGAVKSLCFTADGRHLAAAGDGTSIWVGAMEPRPHSIDTLDKLRPHHFEQVNALVAWKGSPILISGSDDGTVRFWDIEKGALWGTFTATIAPAVADTAEVREVDWVFSTPEGLYDAPPTATKLIRVRSQDRPLPLEPFEKTHREFRLGERMLVGKDLGARPPKSVEPPPIAISVPPRSDSSLPASRLSIALGADDLSDIRLYQNDVLVPCPGKDAGFDVDVPLVPGRNRFYVMASRPGAYDACSNSVDVEYDAPQKRGQVHVLAIGIGKYDRRQLRYPQSDARQFGDVLNGRGGDANNERGLRIVLEDEKVTEQSVEDAFGRIARRVEDRPEDTVVVFLAGHAGVFQDTQGFCLLLPSYPFREDAPQLVAARGAEDGDDGQADPKVVLPYATIATNLARLKALRRLVIVDACRAEAILEDGRVRAIQKWLETSAHRARTSYLMAARGDQPAFESDLLRHGLLTYAILRGMNAIPQAADPKEVADLHLAANADFNRDGLLSTSELDAYVKQVLPRLTTILPGMGGGPRARGVGASAAPGDDSRRGPRLQGAEVSFILVPL
jgi:WD40 repeat protein/uncharacterized caspase-like protein